MRDNSTSVSEIGGLGVAAAAPKKLIELLQPLATEIEVARGKDLFVKDDLADALFVLLKGAMEIATLVDDGRRLAHILIGEGAIFGEMALLEGGKRSASVSAKEDSTVWKISGSRVMERMRQDSELAIELLLLTLGRLRWMSAELEGQAFLTVEVRLAKRLSFLLQTIGNEGVIRISQADLAEHVGATREAVSKVLGEWKDAGVIEIGRGRLKLLDADALFDVSNLGTH